MILTAIAIVSLLAAAAVRAGGFSMLQIPRADALRDAADGRRGANTVARLLDHRDRLPAAINAVHSALLLAAAVPATWLVAEEIRGPGVVWLMLAMVVGLWLVGDYIPRTLGRWQPRTVAYRLAPVVRVAARWGVAANELLVDEEELDANGEEEDEEDEQEERELISSVLEFTDTIVREVMVPRADMVTINRNAGIAELAAVAAEHGFSRLPVTDGPDGEIIGMVLTKDALGAYASGQQVDTIERFRRDVAFVPETKHVSDLLREMQASKAHLGIVVDEFGDITGLVTIEDLLEELVGEISDEHDEVEQLITLNDDGSYLVDPRVDVAELADVTGVSLPDDEWDTVAGLVLGLAERVPEEGEEFEINGLMLRVTRLQGRRVAEVVVRRVPASIATEASG